VLRFFQQEYNAMTDINYSYSIGAQPTGNAEPTTLWSSHGVRVIPLTANVVVLFNPNNDARLLVQPEVARALEQCFCFKSLEEHLDHLFDTMPPLREQPADALQILQLVRDAGIFESADMAWQRLTANTNNAPPLDDSPVRLFILTCDRPEALQRLLNALQEQGLPQQVEALFVIDDSRKDENEAANAGAIESAQSGMHIPIYHIDTAARADLISHLKVSLAESKHASVDFLLTRSHWGQAPTYGLARNLALLLSVNYRALVLDDDILPQALLPPLPAKNLTFDYPNARESVLYPSATDMQQHTLIADYNPLAAMLQSLGQPLGKILSANLSGASALKGIDGRLTTSLEAKSRVHLSQCGTWGDPGTKDSEWIFFQPEASIKRLLDRDSEPEKLLAARTAWIGYRGATIGPHGTLSHLTGLDHRALLPPYLPAGRGEDLLFGIMLQRLHPESAVYNEGWAVAHYPVENRSARGRLSPVKRSATIMMLADWLGRATGDEAGIPPETRLFMLADEISRVSQMTEAALEDLVRKELLQWRTSLLARCMDHLDALSRLENLPGARSWRTFLEQSRDNLVDQIQSQEPHPVADALTRATYDLETLRRRGLAFSEAIKAWPAICQAAREFELR
jgi:hypothetical protein